MRLYLSSYGFGDEVDTLCDWARDRRLGFVPNALDYVDAEPRERSNAQRLAELRSLGIATDVLDLADYFGDPEELGKTLYGFDGVWVRGGNTFVLRKAMSLSGFDDHLRDRVDSDFLYAGYSAGACVLAPDLRGLQQVDDPNAIPYAESSPQWEGLGLLDYLILPHYDSDHPESPLIAEEVKYCERHGIPFRTLRDGEVLAFEQGPR